MSWTVDSAGAQIAGGVFVNDLSGTVNAPSDISAGDGLVLMVVVGDSGGTGYDQGDITLPSDFAILNTADVENGYWGWRTIVAFKTATGSEPSTYTASWISNPQGSSSAWGMAIIRISSSSGAITLDQAADFTSPIAPAGEITLDWPTLSGLSTSSDLVMYFATCGYANPSWSSIDSNLTVDINEPNGVPAGIGYGSILFAHEELSTTNSVQRTAQITVDPGVYGSTIAFYAASAVFPPAWASRSSLIIGGQPS